MKFKTCFIAFLVVLLQVLSAMGVSAAANDAVVTPNISDYSIAVSGELTETRAGTNLILQIKDASSGVHAVEFATSRFNAKGKVIFSFPKIYLPIDMNSGDYTVEISGTELANPIVIPYTHTGSDKLHEILTAIKDRGESSVGSVVGSYEKALMLDMTAYKSFTSGLSVYEAYMTSQLPYTVPSTYTEPEDREIIISEIERLLDNHEIAIALAEFDEIEDAKDSKNWITSYYDALGFNADNPLTSSLNESTIKEYVTQVQGKESFASKIADAQNLSTTEAVRDYIYENALLAFIKEGRASTVWSMLTKSGYDSLFVGIDSRLGDLKSTKLSKCLNPFIGTYYDSYSSAVDALNEQIEEYFDDPPKTESQGSSGGGSKGGSFSIQIGAVQQTPTVPAPQKAFSDMADASWAVEAVNYLATKNIVNGRSETIFAPNDPITRAEFVKMAVSALGLGIAQPEEIFGDVSIDAWYAPSVASAYKKGIVTGDEKGNFNPGANITRQDILTILYRALGKSGDERSCTSFIDEEEISEYALPAVTYFSTRGVVNGMGDGSFGPKLQATRAQAAVILYNIIKTS